MSEPARDDLPTSPPAPTYSPRIGRVLRFALRDLYDYLGVFLVASTLWSTLFLSLLAGAATAAERVAGRSGPLPVLLFSSIGWAVAAAILGPLTAGLFRLARNVAARRDPELLDLLWAWRERLAASIRLAALQGAVTLLLGFGLLIAVSWPPGRLVTDVVRTAFAYAVALWGLLSLYQWALFAEPELGGGAPVRNAYVLAIESGLLTHATLIVLLLTGGMLAMSVVGGLLLGAGWVALVATHCVRESLRRHGLLPPDPTEGDPGERDAWGHGWHE